MPDIAADPVESFSSFQRDDMSYTARRARDVAETRTSRGSHPAQGRDGPAEPEPRKRRVMDIEDLVAWAIKHELPKREAGGSWGTTATMSPMFRMLGIGTVIDNWNREPGFPSAMGGPHPDALRIEAAILRLDDHKDQVIGDALQLGPDFAAAPDDEAEAMRAALGQMAALVTRTAKLGKRPYWQSRPTQSKVTHANGAPVVLRWESRTVALKHCGDLVEEVLVPVKATRANHYPDGSFCSLQFDQEPKTILRERADYLAWWGALHLIAAELFGELETFAVLPPSAPQKPWLGEAELGKPARVFADLTARVYHDDRATAAAVRSLGQRRLQPARRGVPAAPIARRPSQHLAAYVGRQQCPK